MYHSSTRAESGIGSMCSPSASRTYAKILGAGRLAAAPRAGLPRGPLFTFLAV